MALIFYFFSVFMILNLNISLSKSNFNLYELSVFFFFPIITMLSVIEFMIKFQESIR